MLIIELGNCKGMEMDFFKRLVNRKEDQISKERRASNRYNVSANYPLFIKVNGKKTEIRNLSLNGVNLTLDSDLKNQEKIKLNIGIKEQSYDIDAQVIFKESQNYGIEILANTNYDHFYHLASPVVIGCSMKQYNTEDVAQNDPHLIKNLYFGSTSSSIAAWYTKEKHPTFQSFEFEVEGCIIRGKENKLMFLSYTDKESLHENARLTHKLEMAPTKASADQEQVLRSFLYWIVLHLNDHPKLQKDLLSFFPQNEN